MTTNYTLAEVATLQNGFAFKSVDYKEDGYFVMRITNVQDGYLSFESPKYIQLKSVERKFILEPGDILISLTGNLGRVGKYEAYHPKAVLNQRVARINPRDHQRLRSQYLFWFLNSQIFKNAVNSGGKGMAQQNVSTNYLSEIIIPLPPLPEQDRIVEILDQADALRQQRHQADELSKRILPALFQEMFGDVRLNPHSWPMDTLQNLGRVVTGSTPPSKLEGMFDGSIPFVTPADLKETWVNHNRSVTEEGAAQSRTVRAGSALVCCIGATIGKMGKSTEKSAFNQQINAVEWFDDSYDSYGLEALKQIRDQIISGASSTTLPIMNKSTFQVLQIPRPPKNLREKFAERVARLETAASNQTTSAAILESLFQTLLHRAFDGSLTANWRESQAAELLQEMEHQSKS